MPDQLRTNFDAVRDMVVRELDCMAMSTTDEVVNGRYYTFEVYRTPNARLIALQSISTWPNPRANKLRKIEHFDVWMPMTHSNKMDDTLDALRQYATCNTEDSSWLAVLRALRLKTAAIKDVLLGEPKGDGLNRHDSGIDGALISWAYGKAYSGVVKRWSQVLQLALREEYKETP